MASDLAEKECIPCKGDVPPLRGADLEAINQRLGNGWRVVEEHHLHKDFELADYSETVAFVNAVAEVAESENHHPNVCFTWGRAEVTVWTHKIDGLTESDFILAAKIDRARELQMGSNS